MSDHPGVPDGTAEEAKTRYLEAVRALASMKTPIYLGIHRYFRKLRTEERPPQRRHKDYLWCIAENWQYLLPSERYAVNSVVHELCQRNRRCEVFLDDLPYDTYVVIRGKKRPGSEDRAGLSDERLDDEELEEELRELDRSARHEDALEIRQNFRLLSFSKATEPAVTP